MRRRFQVGHISALGKTKRVWVARYVEPRLEEGKTKRVLRARVIGSCQELSKSAARGILEKWLRPLNEGLYTPIESAAFEIFYEKWERDLLPTYGESTRAFYRDTARRWILPYFREMRLSEIRPEHIQQFMNLFGDRYSRSVLRHVRATLNCIFGTAVNWQYLRQNPAMRLKLPAGKATKRAVVLEPDEMRRLIGALPEPYRAMVALAATTGLRESELFGLKWEDLDLEARTSSVKRRVYRHKIGETKTPQSVREIPLAAGIVAELGALPRGINGFIFAGRRGGFLRTNKVMAEHIAPTAKTLGLAGLTWRTFRRSAESAMHNAGVPLKVQQAVLRHTNPNTTLLYAESDQRAKKAAMDWLGGFIFLNLSQVGVVSGSGFAN